MRRTIWCDNMTDLVVITENNEVVIELWDENISRIEAKLTLSQAETLQLMLGDAIEELKKLSTPSSSPL